MLSPAFHLGLQPGQPPGQCRYSRSRSRRERLRRDADGAAIGKTGHYDFRRFCALTAELEGGVYLNLGSAVLLPEVFLKALTAVRNLGYKVVDITTANFDFIRHYRPVTNVVNRPTLEGGRGFNFTGHHEIMIPLLAACLIQKL